MNAIHEEEYKGFMIKIEQDDCQHDSPRDWCNLGTMVCWHSRYNLGDGQPKIDSQEWFEYELGEDVSERLYKKVESDYAENPNLVYNEYMQLLWQEFSKDNIILPLYLYDHSGITMNTTGFNCPWDSGQVGFIYVSKNAIRKEYEWKNLIKKRIEEIEKYLCGEIEVYDQYLRGEIYGFIVEDKEGEEIDSCWSFYGDYESEHGALQAGKESADYQYKVDLEKKQARIKEQIKNHVPLHYRAQA